MGFFKAMRTTVMCAMGAAFSMGLAPKGVSAEMLSKSVPTEKTQTAPVKKSNAVSKITPVAQAYAQQFKSGGLSSSYAINQPNSETYNVSKVLINFDAKGDVSISFVGVSAKDENGGYRSVSGQKTFMHMVMQDSRQGTFGLDKVDTRVQDLKINYLDPLNSNAADFEATIIANKRTSNVLYMFMVNGNEALETNSAQVNKIILQGKGAEVIINGSPTSQGTTLDERNIESATSRGPKLKLDGLPVDIVGVERNVIPEGGTVQLQPVKERVTFPGTPYRNNPYRRN